MLCHYNGIGGDVLRCGNCSERGAAVLRPYKRIRDIAQASLEPGDGFFETGARDVFENRRVSGAQARQRDGAATRVRANHRDVLYVGVHANSDDVVAKKRGATESSLWARSTVFRRLGFR